MKQFFCKHKEIQALPKIEMVLRDLETYREISIFNQVEYKCRICAKEGNISLPVILTSKTAGSLMNRIIEGYIAQDLSVKEVKIV